MKNNIILALLFTILLTSCTKNEKNYTVKEVDGIKVFHNKNIPSDPNFKITPKEVFTIQGYDENAKDSLRNFIHPQDIAVDRSGNIYVLDSRLSSIKKFDKNGNYIRSIGRKGTGPGEFTKAVFLLIMNDTLLVSDGGNKNHLTFDTAGNFVKNSFVENNGVLMRMYNVDANSFISTNIYWEQIENEIFHVNDLHLRDSKMKFIKSINKQFGKYTGVNFNFFDYVTPFCVGNNKIYTAENSNSNYIVNVMTNQGELVYRIKKDFRKIPILENELSTFEESRKQALLDEEEREFSVRYKKVVNANGMFVTKDGYLLIQIPIERNKQNEFDYVVDAFKDGVFINRFKMDIGKGFDFFNSDHKRRFVGNRIYYQNREDNCVTVYEY